MSYILAMLRSAQGNGRRYRSPARSGPRYECTSRGAIRTGAPGRTSESAGGGAFRFAFDPVISARGDIVFIGDITPAPGTRRDRGVFLYSGGTLTRIAGPGDAMPGGGAFAAPAFQPGNWSINDAGSVAFSAQLDTDTLGIGVRDTGLYVWSQGALNLVARTGTDLPGLGTILALSPPDFVGADRPRAQR